MHAPARRGGVYVLLLERDSDGYPTRPVVALTAHPIALQLLQSAGPYRPARGGRDTAAGAASAGVAAPSLPLTSLDLGGCELVNAPAIGLLLNALPSLVALNIGGTKIGNDELLELSDEHPRCYIYRR